MKRQIRKILSAVAVMLMAFVLQSPVYAAEAGGSIIIDFSCENHSLGIPGGEFSIVKAVDIENGTYSLSPSMTELGVTVDDILNMPEETAWKLAEKGPEKYAGGVTDDVGRLRMSGLDDGIWLVWQTGRYGDAESYELSAPFFVSIPEWEDGDLVRERTVYPKTSKINVPTETPTVTPTVTPTTTPTASKGTSGKSGSSGSTPSSTSTKVSQTKTGDTNRTGLFIALMATSALAVLSVIIRKEEKNK